MFPPSSSQQENEKLMELMHYSLSRTLVPSHLYKRLVKQMLEPKTFLHEADANKVVQPPHFKATFLVLEGPEYRMLSQLYRKSDAAAQKILFDALPKDIQKKFARPQAPEEKN